MVNFQNSESSHKCTSVRNGDLITWKCPICPDYERIYNWRIGKFISVKTNEFQHVGSHEGSERNDLIIPLTQNLINQN